MTCVDVLIVGGGIQGLVLLRDITEAGYACLLVTRHELGTGQTLHSHGLMNSGTGLVSGQMHAELRTYTLPYLRRLGVPVYGETSSYLALPTAAVEQLAPLWSANDYRPQLLENSRVPTGLRLPPPVYHVPGYHVPKRRLVRALAEGLLDRIVQGQVTRNREMYKVRLTGTGETIDVQAHAVVVAAGCGTTRFLRHTFDVDAGVVGRIGYVKSHMLCLRSPVGVLPPIGTVVTPEVLVVGHVNRKHDDVGKADQVSWYVTPADTEPQRYDDASDEAIAEVEPSVVARAVELLRQLVPRLSEHDEGIEATVFAGYKQDIDGQITRPMFGLVDDDHNVFVALPSVLVNAWPNARQALACIRALGDPVGTIDDFPAVAHAVDVGQVNELREGVDWHEWGTFAAKYQT